MSQIKDYTLAKLLGAGSYAQVYWATNQEGRPVALKVINPEIAVSRAGFIRKEFTIGQKINEDCQFTPEYLEIFSVKLPTDNSANLFPTKWLGKPTLVMVIEYIEGDSLKDYISQKYKQNAKINVYVIADALIRIGETIKCLHSYGFAHGDLNPGNIVMNKEYYLIDFGGSCGFPVDFTGELSKEEICELGNIITPPLYTLPLITENTVKDKRYYLKHPLSSELTKEYYLANDVYSLVVIGLGLINPEIINANDLKIKIVYQPEWVHKLVQDYRASGLGPVNVREKLVNIIVKYYENFHNISRPIPYPTIQELLDELQTIFKTESLAKTKTTPSVLPPAPVKSRDPSDYFSGSSTTLDVSTETLSVD